MGAEYIETTIRAKNKTELERKFKEAQEQARYEYGHRGYTGTLAECDGLEVLHAPGLIFLSRAEAQAAADKQAKKCGPAIAAPYVNIAGEHTYLIIAICSC
jgi:hypothetical protein